MEQTIGRQRVARAYAWLIVLAALVVILQGIMFGGFHSGKGADFLEAHGIIGEVSGIVVLVVLTALGCLARFPKEWRIGWFTLGLGVLWNIQAHVFGYGIEDERTLEMVHIPGAFLVFGLALYLAGKTRGALLGRI